MFHLQSRVVESNGNLLIEGKYTVVLRKQVYYQILILFDFTGTWSLFFEF